MMQLELVIDSPAIYIGYDALNRCLYVDWKGEHDQDSSQAACLLMLKSLQGRPCHKILNDNSSLARTTMQLTVWGPWWLNEMRNAGLQVIAWVLPRGLLARQAVESAVHGIDLPRVGTFDDVASACVWLQQQPAPLVSSQR